MEENSPKKEDYGVIKIADDVIATIAGLAAMEVEGVAGMAGGVTSGITEMLGKKNMTKGVKLDVNDKDVAVDLYDQYRKHPYAAYFLYRKSAKGKSRASEQRCPKAI